MTGQDPEASAAPPQPPIMLARWARWTSMLCALATLVLGSFAVFKTTNQAGSVALLGVAIALLLIGLIGRIPERGNVGQFAFTFGPSAAKLDSPDQEEREDAAKVVVQQAEEQVSRLEPNAQAVTRANAILRERMLMNVVAGVAQGLGVAVAVEPTLPVDGRILRPDLIISPARTGLQFRPFPVEVSTSTDLQHAGRVARYAQAMGAKTALLVGMPQPDIARHHDSLNIKGVEVFLAHFSDDLASLADISQAIQRTMESKGPKSASPSPASLTP